ncbi:DUF418 domain-containing protein [Tessaracoccus sp. G1721]
MQTRQLWLDLARGLAVVSMVVAHTAPAGGIFTVTEYLTAPLFAAAIGAGIELAWRGWRDGALRFVGEYAVRGALLFLAGVLLQPLYWQIVVVLQWLGALTVIVAVLVALRVRGRVALVAGAAVVAAAYPLMVATRGPWAVPGALAPAVQFAFSGGPYRLMPMVASGLLGVGLTHWLGRDTVSPRATLALALGSVLGAGLAVVIGSQTAAGASPYSGTYGEMVASLAVVTAVLAGSRWLTDAVPPGLLTWLDPLVATGRLAMTAYVLQLVVLRVLTDAFLGGGRDDHWWVMLTTLAVLVGFSWVWHRFVGMGPFERLLRLPRRLLRR